jgi:two-component system sensor histidine kinase/response regulator
MAVETKQRALAGGAKDFLAKPFDLVEVGLRIQNLLESRLLHQLLQNQNQILEEKVKERTIELETANKELETANKELKGLDQAKVDFLQLISHEIRTPLNGIKGFLDILKSEIQSPELLEYLQFLDDSVARLEIFSYQALMITELRTRKTHIQIEEVPLRELFDKTAKQLQEKLRTKNINVSLINDSGLNIIPGNRQLLQVCFDCLINNAIQYSPPNDVVIVKVYPDDTFIVCEFIDKGPGFSSTALDHLFKLFWVGKEHVDQNRGLNLGLVKLIMDAHNGQIAVVNNQPNGAIVRMTFPT